jgi:serine/threonine protein kinase
MSNFDEICEVDKLKIQEYEITGSLGSGAYGKVKMAKRIGEPDRQFVLKFIPIKNPQAPRHNTVDLVAIYSEIAILQKIQISGCVSDLLCYYDHFVDCSNPEMMYMIIVTLTFPNAIGLDKFIDTEILDRKISLGDIIDDLETRKDDISEQLELTDDDDERSSLIKSFKNVTRKLEMAKDKLEETPNITPLSRNVILTIFYNILHAMDRLHKLGIGHGDLKPENILINPKTYAIQIIDFGISCMSDCKVSGTLLYDSPEILDDIVHGSKKLFNVKELQRSDVFSLGLVFYKLGNGRLPSGQEVIFKGQEWSVIPKLLDYYKTNLNSNRLFSMYNENSTLFDEKINTFIESILINRPDVSQLLDDIKTLINEYNILVEQKKGRLESKTSPTLPSPDFMTSPIRLFSLNLS